MDGIFAAYHNTQTMFGFEYLPLEEIDILLFGTSQLANAAFKMILQSYNHILDVVTAFYPPNTDLILTFKSQPDFKLEVFSNTLVNESERTDSKDLKCSVFNFASFYKKSKIRDLGGLTDPSHWSVKSAHNPQKVNDGIYRSMRSKIKTKSQQSYSFQRNLQNFLSGK